MLSFLFLAFARAAHLLGLPKLAAHSNAVQLFSTLRCVGLAFELHDEVELQPSVVQILSYLYNFMGLFTGNSSGFFGSSRVFIQRKTRKYLNASSALKVIFLYICLF